VQPLPWDSKDKDIFAMLDDICIANKQNPLSMSSNMARVIWNPAKLQSYKIEGLCGLMLNLYLAVHKSFVSTSLNIIHRGCTFHLSYPYWTITYYTKLQ
jgi:hypothetical protein